MHGLLYECMCVCVYMYDGSPQWVERWWNFVSTEASLSLTTSSIPEHVCMCTHTMVRLSEWNAGEILSPQLTLNYSARQGGVHVCQYVGIYTLIHKSGTMPKQ
jgi:hypothetical protein